jgi:hypothetical protein
MNDEAPQDLSFGAISEPKKLTPKTFKTISAGCAHLEYLIQTLESWITLDRIKNDLLCAVIHAIRLPTHY